MYPELSELHIRNYQLSLGDNPPKCTLPTCENKVELHYTNKHWNEFCCKSCQTKYCKNTFKNKKDQSEKSALYHKKGIIGTPEQCKKTTERNLKNWQNKEYADKTKKTLQDGLNKFLLSDKAKDPELIKRKTRAIIELTFSGKNSRSKTFIVHGLNCLGNYEKRFIEILHKLGISLPTKPIQIHTPTGRYLPDFEYPDHYVEIKSTWTLAKSERDGQLEKIKWVNENIKPVVIINLDIENELENYLLKLKN